MIQNFVEIVVATLSFLTLLQMFPAVARLLRDSTTRSSTLALAALVIGGVLGDTQYLTDSRAFKLGYIAFFVVLMLLTLARGKPQLSTRITLAPLLLLSLLWVWLFSVNIVQNEFFTSVGGLLMRLAPGAIYLMLLLVWRHTPVTREQLAPLAMVAVCIPGLLTPFVVNAWRACDEFKCGVFNGMLTGPYSSENYLSQQAVIAFLLYLFAYGLRRSILPLLLVSAWLLSTETRTSQYTLIVALVIALVMWARDRRRSKAPGVLSRFFLSLLVLVFVVIAFSLALTAAPSDFSNRGQIWIRALEIVEGNEVTGLGVDRWSYLQDTGLASLHYQHSLYIFIYFSGGIVAIILLFLWVRQSLVACSRYEGRLAPAAALGTAFLMLGLLEVVSNPLAVDGTLWITLALFTVPSAVFVGQETIGSDRDARHET